MIGGSYSLTGGYWALYAVQTPGLPNLTITYSGNSVLVSWPNTDAWSANSSWTTTNGTNYLNLTSPTGNLFFRLSNP